MFVSESNLFSGDSIKLRVISCEGAVWDTDTSPTINVEKLITLAVSHFYDPYYHKSTISEKYRLVLVSSKKSLENEKTLTEEELRSNDELLLVKIRNQPQCELYSDAQNLQGPTENEISEKTRNVLQKNNPVAPAGLDTSLDTDMRRILFSLVEAAARLLAPSPNGMEIFNMVKAHLRSKSQPTPDTRSVRQLVDMGFPEQKVMKALSLKKLNASDALEWLLQHQDDVEESEPQSHIEQDDSSRTNSSDDKSGSVIDAFAALLETFREARRRDFKPDMKAVDNLKQMGFDEEESKEALRITGNNQASACAWLLGERRASLEDMDQGLDVNGPVYKAVISNPTIQLSLTNPKVLLAFLSMLENPSTAKVWFNDRDTSPILNQIFKIYHTEKHAMRTVSIGNNSMASGPQEHVLDNSNSSSGTAL